MAGQRAAIQASTFSLEKAIANLFSYTQLTDFRWIYLIYVNSGGPLKEDPMVYGLCAKCFCSALSYNVLSVRKLIVWLSELLNTL